MSGARIVEEAIVLGAVDYGESDRVVTLLTRGHGRIGAFAAGARRSRRRFAGALEPFTRLRVELTERRGDLLFLDSCTVVDAHAGLRADLARLGHAGHAAELARELCREREANEALFLLLAAYLEALAGREADPSALLAYELAALDRAGVAPRFADCAICGAAAGAGALFDPGHGGAVCAACVPGAHPGAVRAEAATLAAAHRLQRAAPFDAAIEDPRVRARVRELVRRFTHHLTGRRQRSLDFLAQVGVEG